MGSSSHSASLTSVGPIEFFKVFLSPKSFNKLKVPVEFFPQITCRIPGIFSLCGPSGSVWKVRLLETDDGFYFEQGWQDFVIDNYMSNGDFCVFRYVNNLSLRVQIFGRDGCEKESAFQGSCSRPCTLDFSASRGRKKAVKNQAKRLGGRFTPQRRDIAHEEKTMALNAALGFVSKNPFTMITMRVSHLYTGFCLPLPRSFWKAHLPHRSQGMTVRDPRGEAWAVRFYVHPTRQMGQLSEGWRKISFTNNIEAGDVCIFELAKPDELELHIFRGVQEITPCKKRSVARGKSANLL